MKLALICTEKLPSPAVKGGAIQLMIDGIVPFFAQTFEVTIYSIQDEELPDHEVMEQIEYIRFPKEEYYEKVTLDIATKFFDVIHVFNRPKVVEQIHHASPNSAIVLSVHNDMFSPMKLSKEEGRKAMNVVSGIATVSDYIKRTITSRYPEAEEKTYVAYSGVDLNQFPERTSEVGQTIRANMRKQLEVEGKKVILFIGRLSKTKGPHVLIEAMKFVVKKHPDAVLLIVGGKWFSDNGINEYVQSLHELAEPLQEQIKFTNYIPAEEIPNVMLSGDVFVCSSQWHEPLARIHYEAMAACLPIITTNRGGNKEVMQNGLNGFVIDEYNRPERFSEAIDYLLKRPTLCEELGKNGRMLVKTYFQYAHTATRYLAIYEKAMERKRETTDQRV